MALFAPMPMPSVKTTMAVNAGNRIRRRTTCFSCMTADTRADGQRFEIGCLVAAFAAGYSAFGLIRHWRFESSYDLAIFDQAVWHLSRFQAPASSIRGYSNLLGDHFSPILALFAPLYWIAAVPETLIVAQAILLALSIVPLHAFARPCAASRGAHAVGELRFILGNAARGGVRRARGGIRAACGGRTDSGDGLPPVAVVCGRGRCARADEGGSRTAARVRRSLSDRSRRAARRSAPARVERRGVRPHRRRRDSIRRNGRLWLS